LSNHSPYSYGYSQWEKLLNDPRNSSGNLSLAEFETLLEQNGGYSSDKPDTIAPENPERGTPADPAKGQQDKAISGQVSIENHGE
jgi:hypothetical protein